MYCSNCGKEIPEGQTSCPECGTPIPKSAAPNETLENIKAGISAGTKKLKGSMDMIGNDHMKIISLVGSVLILLSPFFHWLSVKITYFGQTEKEAENLFGLDIGICTFSAVMILIAAIILVAWEAADYIPALGQLKEKLENVNGISAIYDYIPLILVGIVFLFVLIVLFNGDYKDGVKLAKGMFEAVGAKGHVNKGLGPIVAFLGIIASAFPKVIQIIKK